MLEILSACWIFEHGGSNSWELSWVNLSLGTWVAIWRPLVEESTSSSWGNRVQSIVDWSCQRWTSYGGGVVHVIITSRARIFTHFLHFLHVREPLLGWVETIRRIFFLEADIFLIFDYLSRVTLLESKSKSRFSSIKGSRRCLVLWYLLIIWTVVSAYHHASRVGAILKSSRGWAEDGTLMLISLILMMLNCLQECASPHLNILVLYWNHLIEIDCLSFILRLGSLVLESDLARAKGL